MEVMGGVGLRGGGDIGAGASDWDPTEVRVKMAGPLLHGQSVETYLVLATFSICSIERLHLFFLDFLEHAARNWSMCGRNRRCM